MQIDIRTLSHMQGDATTFAYSLDLDWYEEMGQKPFDSPLAVTGSVQKRADAYYLQASAQAGYHTLCDRCLEQIYEQIAIHLCLRIVEQESELDTDVYAPGGIVDVDTEVISALILSLPSQRLCKEDCKGLCPECGVNLNIESCHCQKKKIDPRLAVLAQLLETDSKE